MAPRRARAARKAPSGNEEDAATLPEVAPDVEPPHQPALASAKRSAPSANRGTAPPAKLPRRNPHQPTQGNIGGGVSDTIDEEARHANARQSTHDIVSDAPAPNDGDDDGDAEAESANAGSSAADDSQQGRDERHATSPDGPYWRHHLNSDPTAWTPPVGSTWNARASFHAHAYSHLLVRGGPLSRVDATLQGRSPAQPTAFFASGRVQLGSQGSAPRGIGTNFWNSVPSAAHDIMQRRLGAFDPLTFRLDDDDNGGNRSADGEISIWDHVDGDALGIPLSTVQPLDRGGRDGAGSARPLGAPRGAESCYPSRPAAHTRAPVSGSRRASRSSGGCAPDAGGSPSGSEEIALEVLGAYSVAASSRGCMYRLLDSLRTEGKRRVPAPKETQAGTGRGVGQRLVAPPMHWWGGDVEDNGQVTVAIVDDLPSPSEKGSELILVEVATADRPRKWIRMSREWMDNVGSDRDGDGRILIKVSSDALIPLDAVPETGDASANAPGDAESTAPSSQPSKKKKKGKQKSKPRTAREIGAGGATVETEGADDRSRLAILGQAASEAAAAATESDAVDPALRAKMVELEKRLSSVDTEMAFVRTGGNLLDLAISQPTEQQGAIVPSGDTAASTASSSRALVLSTTAQAGLATGDPADLPQATACEIFPPEGATDRTATDTGTHRPSAAGLGGQVTFDPAAAPHATAATAQEPKSAHSAPETRDDLLQAALGLRGDLFVRAPVGTVADGYFRVRCGSYELMLKTPCGWTGGLLRIPRPARHNLAPELCAMLQRSTEVGAFLDLGMITTAQEASPPVHPLEGGAQYVVDLPAAAPDSGILPVRIGEELALLSLKADDMDAAGPSERMVCTAAPLSTAEAHAARQDHAFEIEVPVGVASGETVIAASPDGLMIIQFEIPADLPPSRVVRVDVSAHSSGGTDS